MKVKDMKGREFNWTVQGKKRGNASALHKRAVELIKEHYPYQVHEEVKLPGSKPTLYFDIVLPNIKMCIEVQGTQHWKMSSLFHENILDLKRQVRRDNKKREWCEENGLRLVHLFDGESNDDWFEKIFA